MHQVQMYLLRQQIAQHIASATGTAAAAPMNTDSDDEGPDLAILSSDDEDEDDNISLRAVAAHAAWVAKVKSVAERAAEADRPLFECTICKDSEKRVVLVPCGHAIGAGCFLQMLSADARNAKRCPMCRAETAMVVQPVEH